MRKLKWLLLLLLLHAGTTHALSVDPNVVSVVTARENSGAIQYRVILKEAGFEHLSTEVQIDWLKLSDNNEGTMAISHSETVIESGFHIINSARFYEKKGKQYLELLGMHTYSHAKERYVFLLEPEGIVKQIEPRLDNQ
jgi:hypothetical protein